MSRWLRSDSGVAAVELAILLPVFAAIVMAAIDFALVFRQQVMLRNAASNGAAYAALQPCDTSGITTAVDRELHGVTSLKPAESVGVSYTDASGGSVAASTCSSTAYATRVSVSANYALLTGSVLGIFGVPSSFAVHGAETTRIQGR